MQRPTLLEGIVVALLFSLMASPLAILLHFLVGGLLVPATFMVTITFFYTLYLLARSRKVPGRLTLAVLSALILLGSLALPGHWIGLIALTLTVGIRACAYSRSLLTGLLHAILGLLGVGIALWVYRQGGSLMLTVWSFFLLQALFVYIPAHLARAQETTPGAAGEDPFPQAYQAAQQALTRLGQFGATKYPFVEP